MKTVPLTIGRLEYGGAEMRLLQLFRRLLAEDAPIKPIVYVISGLPGRLDEAYRSAGVELVYGRTGIVGVFDIFLLCSRRGVSVFHGNTLLSSGLYCAGALLAGVKTRYAHLRSTQYDGDGWFVTFKERTFALLTRLFATHIVGVCDGARALAGVGAERWLTIYNGLELPANKEPTGSLPEGTKIKVLMLGRLDWRKDPLRLLPIAAELQRSKRAPDVTIDVVGSLEGDQGTALKLAVAEAGLGDIVRLAGETNDPIGWLQRSSVLISLSRNEGLPGVVLEALSVGTPVVATDLPGVREISSLVPGIRIMGDNASLKEWTEAIFAAASEPLEVRSERIAAFRRSPFTMDRHVTIMRSLWLNGFSAARRLATEVE